MSHKSKDEQPIIHTPRQLHFKGKTCELLCVSDIEYPGAKYTDKWFIRFGENEKWNPCEIDKVRHLLNKDCVISSPTTAFEEFCKRNRIVSL